MDETFSIRINGVTLSVASSVSVAAAIVNARQPSRVSVHGEPRAPLCGMGICMECRATVNGVRHVRTCQALCEPGMDVVTG